MAKIIHAMIRVLDEEQSVDFYNKAFGLEVAARYPFDEFTLVYLRNVENDFEVELTVNHGQKDPYTHGSGYGHIAVTVANLEEEHSRFQELGLDPNPIKQFDREGEMMARFFFVHDPDGYKIEVLQHYGRYL